MGKLNDIALRLVKIVILYTDFYFKLTIEKIQNIIENF